MGETVLSDWFLKNQLTLCMGDTGIGKTQFMMNLSALVSNGGVFPDGSQCSAGQVLYYNALDGLDWLALGLEANQADKSMIEYANDATSEESHRLWNLDGESLDELDDLLRLKQFKLIVIDDINLPCFGKLSKKNLNGLKRLEDMAKKYQCAIIATTWRMCNLPRKIVLADGKIKLYDNNKMIGDYKFRFEPTNDTVKMVWG